MKDDPSSLDKLHDLALPAPIPIWPPAPGWWLVLALLLVVAAFTTILLVHRHRASAYRRAALHELPDLVTVGELATLLKRTALVAGPRTGLAALSGQPWLDWLDQSCKLPVPEAIRSELLDSPYTEPERPASVELRDFITHWVTHHHA